MDIDYDKDFHKIEKDKYDYICPICNSKLMEKDLIEGRDVKMCPSCGEHLDVEIPDGLKEKMNESEKRAGFYYRTDDGKWEKKK